MRTVKEGLGLEGEWRGFDAERKGPALKKGITSQTSRRKKKLDQVHGGTPGGWPSVSWVGSGTFNLDQEGQFPIY